ncbi:AcrR family transcriptional regulator [Arthrobacter woluwensis]|uniref:TetR/AcrR family transcriptional regulator n=1 Tax=Arthrobacter woluwensis TaxID=156980 RepID=UPI0027821AFB|nr:TetR family transcriptional regulator [Arthrobacter woluwensis]MDQ0709783.1 AcrR family transcriptional regulator [Arthrobacter woluwensis]
MRSAPQNDLTTKARIRDTAIRLYARDGFAKTSLRAIATEAGVSPGLLIHHFGSAAGLREACDEQVLGVTTERASSKMRPGGLKHLMAEFNRNPEGYTLEMDYLRQALLEGTATSASLFQHLVELSESVICSGIEDGTVRPFTDIRGVAVLTALTSVGSLAFGPIAAKALGVEGDWQSVMQRIGGPGLELYTHGFYTTDAFLTAYREATSPDHDEPQEA